MCGWELSPTNHGRKHHTASILVPEFRKKMMKCRSDLGRPSIRTYIYIEPKVA